MPSVVALIPARSGSKRIRNKNIREIGGHPLMAYTIRTAIESRIFADVVVSTDSKEYAAIAKKYGARVIDRPARYARDDSPDIEWVQHALSELPAYDAFSILRPTSPFRQPETIRRAWAEFTAANYDSLRAMEPVKDHPGKMWVIIDGMPTARPLLPNIWTNGTLRVPWHSMPTQSLPKYYKQNASLEIAWCRTVRVLGTIAGDSVHPFFTEGFEGFDLNNGDDWIIAEHRIANDGAKLPEIHLPMEVA